MKAGAVNIAAAILAVAGSVAVGAVGGQSVTNATPEAASEDTVLDARGQRFEARRFQRIVSATTTADRVLLDLVAPDRIAALTAYGAEHSVDAPRYVGHRTVASLADLETILSWEPDLVIASGPGDPRRAARLAEAGIPVFDLGTSYGSRDLVHQVRTLGRLLAVGPRGERYADSLASRLERIACDVPADERPGAMYLGAWGGSLLGGTRGSSYHDLLELAGLDDVAAGDHQGWPQYTAEDVLALDPEIIVTRQGATGAICGFAGLATLRACSDRGRVIELPASLLDDPGPALLEAAELLYTLVHGSG